MDLIALQELGTLSDDQPKDTVTVSYGAVWPNIVCVVYIRFVFLLSPYFPNIVNQRWRACKYFHPAAETAPKKNIFLACSCSICC